MNLDWVLRVEIKFINTILFMQHYAVYDLITLLPIQGALLKQRQFHQNLKQGYAKKKRICLQFLPKLSTSYFWVNFTINLTGSVSLFRF